VSVVFLFATPRRWLIKRLSLSLSLWGRLGVLGLQLDGFCLRPPLRLLRLLGSRGGCHTMRDMVVSEGKGLWLRPARCKQLLLPPDLRGCTQGTYPQLACAVGGTWEIKSALFWHGQEGEESKRREAGCMWKVLQVNDRWREGKIVCRSRRLDLGFAVRNTILVFNTVQMHEPDDADHNPTAPVVTGTSHVLEVLHVQTTHTHDKRK
jgi:hypothetical protein